MNDIRETLGEDGTGSGEGYPAGARAGRAKRCCRPSSRKKRDEMIVLSSAVVCCFVPMFVVAGGSGGKKGADAKVQVVAVAGGGAATGGAAEAREKMEVDGSKMVKMRLVSEHSSVPSGGETWLGVDFEIEKGWHTYWQNSGDSGMPPTFEFTVEPAGALEIGEVQWPAPVRHVADGDILDYVYEWQVVHLFKTRLTDKAKPGDTIKITCKASWLVCKEACLPGEGSASLRIAVGETKAGVDPWRVDDAKKLLPVKPDSKVTAVWRGDSLEIRDATLGGGAPLSFFPFAADGDVVPIDLVKNGSSKSGTLNLGFDPADLKRGGRVRGVVRADYGQHIPDAGTRAYLIDVEVPITPKAPPE
jgi:DsbC/DsbD-like thiol-disulfide interchange protein